jgi:hypothetical protein
MTVGLDNRNSLDDRGLPSRGFQEPSTAEIAQKTSRISVEQTKSYIAFHIANLRQSGSAVTSYRSRANTEAGGGH